MKSQNREPERTPLEEAQDKIHWEGLSREWAGVWSAIPKGALVEHYRKMWGENESVLDGEAKDKAGEDAGLKK